jgi:hypothetical protein
MGNSWVPPIMLAVAGALHVMWFNGGVKGYLKRQRASRKAAKETKAIQQPTQASLTDVLPESIEPKPSPNAITPQDSPLVTPYTPGTTPMTLRDSYLFPNLSNLPNVSIPTIPSIPSIPTFADFTAALPKSLAPENMNFGFKDAVKNRWEEQRGRFEQVRGRGMGLTLGGLGLRRRFRSEAEDTGGASVEEEEIREVKIE